MSKIKRQLQAKFCITATQLSPGQPVIIEIEDTEINIVSGNILAIAYLHQPQDKNIVARRSMSPVEQDIRQAIKNIFSVTELAQIQIPVYRLWRDHITDYDKTSIIKALHKMGYKSMSGRHQYPIIYPGQNISGNEAGQKLGKQLYEMKSGNTTYYQFNKTDFLDE